MPVRFDVAYPKFGLKSEQALVRAPAQGHKKAISTAMETETPIKPIKPIKIDIFIDYT